MRRRGGTQKLRQLPRWAADGGEEREHTEKKSITKLFWSCQVFFFTRCCYLQFTDRRLMIRDNWGRGSTNNSQIKPQLVVIFINNRILKYKELCSFIDFFLFCFLQRAKNRFVSQVDYCLQKFQYAMSKSRISIILSRKTRSVCDFVMSFKKTSSALNDDYRHGVWSRCEKTRLD